LMVDPPHYPRYVSVTPGLAVLVALGTVLIGTTLSRVFTWRRISPKPAWGLPVLLVVMLAVADQKTYIVDYLPQKLIYGEPTVQLNEVADILQTFHGRYHVYYFSDVYLDMIGTDILFYRSPENMGAEVYGPVKDLQTTGPHAFLIAPGRRDEALDMLLEQFPGGEIQEYDNPRLGQSLVYIYFVTIPEKNAKD
jgi:hypothetical protein